MNNIKSFDANNKHLIELIKMKILKLKEQLSSSHSNKGGNTPRVSDDQLSSNQMQPKHTTFQTVVENTEMSEEQGFGDVGERPLFELQFNIYYTKYDLISIPVFTYIVPKTDEDVILMNGPTDMGEFEFGKPVFIAKLTS